MTIDEAVRDFWPEDCVWFFKMEINGHPNIPHFQLHLNGLEIALQEKVSMFGIDRRGKKDIPIIASVAAMHWTNKAESLPHGPSASPEEMRAFGLCVRASAAWRSLAKEV